MRRWYPIPATSSADATTQLQHCCSRSRSVLQGSALGLGSSDGEDSGCHSSRPHGVRVDLFSSAKPAPQVTLGAKVDWMIKVDGRVTYHTKQGFGDHDVVRQHFTAGSGRHVVKVFKNGAMVQQTVVRF